MAIQSESRSAITSKLHGLAAILRPVGWLSCWLQLGLAVAAVFTLGFAISGRNVAENTNSGMGVGLLLALCGSIVLLFNAFLAFRTTRMARRLRHPDPDRHPRRVEVTQVLRLGVIMGLIGMGLVILGGGASLGVLAAKSFARPQGVTIYDPELMVRGLDVLVALANMNAITGHFVGTIASLGLLDRVART
jgi:Protein of unknown function (DUF3611)